MLTRTLPFPARADLDLSEIREVARLADAWALACVTGAPARAAERRLARHLSRLHPGRWFQFEGMTFRAMPGSDRVQMLDSVILSN